MKKYRIVAFAGRKRSGKTTLSRLLEKEEGAVVLSIADYLKRLCAVLLGMTYDELTEKKDNGYTFDVSPDERWFSAISDETGIPEDTVMSEIGGRRMTSVRDVLQVVGTDLIRKYRENWHVEKMAEEMSTYPEGTLFTVDDVRFPNEVSLIKELDGDVFFIVRPDVCDVSNHSSETALKWQDFDASRVILNSNVTLEDFRCSFLEHYRDGFMGNAPKSVMLDENSAYLKCGRFGIGGGDELLDSVIEQIKDDGMFIRYGIIRYHAPDDWLAYRYAVEVDGAEPSEWKKTRGFMTYNPLITENLKMYL